MKTTSQVHGWIVRSEGQAGRLNGATNHPAIDVQDGIHIPRLDRYAEDTA